MQVYPVPPRPKHEPTGKQAVVYILRCSDGSLYTGWTTNLQARLSAHAAGTASRYTRSRLPCRLAGWWRTAGRSEALREEARFKGLARSQKLAALVRGSIFGRRMRRRAAPPALAGELGVN